MFCTVLKLQKENGVGIVFEVPTCSSVLLWLFISVLYALRSCVALQRMFQAKNRTGFVILVDKAQALQVFVVCQLRNILDLLLRCIVEPERRLCVPLERFGFLQAKTVQDTFS